MVNANKQRMLILGGSRVGKSTIINALLNKSASRKGLQGPALTANSQSTNGTTDAVTAYISAKDDRAIVDTIGLTDPRFTQKQVLDNLYSVMFNFRVGLTCVILVVKHDIFTTEEEMQMQLFGALLGKEWTQRAYLIITHFDDDPITIDEYMSRNHGPAFQRVLASFPKERIVIGSLQVDSNPLIDQHLVERRRTFVTGISRVLAAIPDREPLRLCVRNLRDFIRYIRNLFCFDTKEDTKMTRLYKAFVDTGKQERLYFHGFTDSICLEEVRGNSDDMFITPCMHVFHFDCIRVWLQDHDTCPNCRTTIQTFLNLSADTTGIFAEAPTEEDLRHDACEEA